MVCSLALPSITGGSVRTASRSRSSILRLIEGYIEINMAPRFPLHAHHIPSRDQEGMQKLRLNRLQVSVPIGAIYNRVEFCMQRHFVPADLHLEVRRIGLPIHHNLVQRALISPLRGKDPTYPFDGAEIGIAKGVGTAHWGRAQMVGIPGAKIAAAFDLAHWFGIGQHGGKVHRLAHANRA